MLILRIAGQVCAAAMSIPDVAASAAAAMPSIHAVLSAFGIVPFLPKSGRLVFLSRRGPRRDPCFGEPQQRGERHAEQPERHHQWGHAVDLKRAGGAYDQIADTGD